MIFCVPVSYTHLSHYIGKLSEEQAHQGGMSGSDWGLSLIHILKQHLIDRWGAQIVEEYWQLYQQQIHTAVNRMNEIGV